MFTLKELDEYVTHDQQVEDSTDGPVVLVTIFHVDPSEIEDLGEKGAIPFAPTSPCPGSSRHSSTAAWEAAARC